MWGPRTGYIRLLFCVGIVLVRANLYPPAINKIINAASADGINLTALPFAPAAFASIEAILVPITTNLSDVINGSRVDTHVHVVPDWYRALVPLSGGNPTPAWDIQSHLEFMLINNIGHDIISISTPGSGVYPGNKAFSVGLARLLNAVTSLNSVQKWPELIMTSEKWVAALVETYPAVFSFYATAPLPYVAAAIKEIDYARDHLGAIGTVLLSNHEGKYLGNPELTPFFAHLESRKSKSEVVFIHPNSPVLNINGSFISADPTIYAPGLVEFYFDFARTIMDLTLSQTIQNFTKIRYHIPQEGGSFPSIEDRVLKSFPALEASSKEIYNTRFWWDSAGPVFYSQIKGLLGYGVPTSQLVFGTDYPYVPPFTYAGSIAAILEATFISAADKQRLFRSNAEVLYGEKL